MIKYTPASERTLSLFRTPFEQQLDPRNRWVRMAELAPWDEMAQVFFRCMSPDQGRASVDLRVVLGALLVKHIQGISDEDTIQYIQENIYAQYFVGLASFQTEPVFVPSLFVEIRKRLGKEGSQQLNDLLLNHARDLRAIKHRAKPKSKPKQERDKEENDNNDDSACPPAAACPATESNEVPPRSDNAAPTKPQRNKGTLKLDATVAPQHIGYPTDTRLLHEARLSSEVLIDELYYGATGFWSAKPRTYRRRAHSSYLAFAKKRRSTKKDINRANKQQLAYLRRNLQHLDRMLDELVAAGVSCPWQHRHWQRLWVIRELYRQQDIMYRDGRRRVDDRIVNIAQPYVRPIQRGKAGKPTEFGAKINLSETEGFVRADQVSFDNFHEGKGLVQQVETYKALYGYYPELLLVDRIYLTRENRKYLKDKQIRHVGKPLGRTPEMSRQEKQKRKREQNKRSEIEGKFGQAKSKYGLDDIQTRRSDTSYAVIGLIFLALNLIKLAKERPFLYFSDIHRSWRAWCEAIISFIFGYGFMNEADTRKLRSFRMPSLHGPCTF